MAAGIAHELNNPLTTVTGFTELALESIPKDTETHTDLEMVLRESLRARAVVRRLLDFARQGESTRARASLNKVIEEVIALSRHLIQTSGVDLSLRLEEDLPWASIDVNQLKQVLLNLIHNALQAMPAGGVMEIKTETASHEQRDWVIISVRDTGVGIPQVHQGRIFEPFYTTKGNQGGTGLGLSVTYGIVTNHGGHIDVESEPGSGSIFAVWLPL
jgi:two-component system NtrC family sensor kinase